LKITEKELVWKNYTFFFNLFEIMWSNAQPRKSALQRQRKNKELHRQTKAGELIITRTFLKEMLIKFPKVK
jgi:hypothetical protein